MIPFVFRQLWRLLIFLLGVMALFLLIDLFWPESGSRMAAFASLLFIYCLMAYIVIPNLMRLFHIFSRPNHIPLYASTGDGWPSDPVNLAIVAKDRNHLVNAMKDAGWLEAEQLNFKNGFREVFSIIFNSHYPNSPLSNLYLFDRKHDVGFQIPTNTAGSARTRHHVRFWKLQKPTNESKNTSHYSFWRDKLKSLFSTENEIWIGAATEETRAIDIQWRTGRLTHGGSHESNKERDYIIQTLLKKDLVSSIRESEPGESIKFRGQQFRTFYVTDGSIKIVYLN